MSCDKVSMETGHYSVTELVWFEITASSEVISYWFTRDYSKELKFLKSILVLAQIQHSYKTCASVKF